MLFWKKCFIPAILFHVLFILHGEIAFDNENWGSLLIPWRFFCGCFAKKSECSLSLSFFLDKNFEIRDFVSFSLNTIYKNVIIKIMYIPEASLIYFENVMYWLLICDIYSISQKKTHFEYNSFLEMKNLWFVLFLKIFDNYNLRNQLKPWFFCLIYSMI